MKQKTFIANTAEEADKLANEFDSSHKVHFAQSHVTAIPTGTTCTVQYTRTMFYEDKKV